MEIIANLVEARRIVSGVVLTLLLSYICLRRQLCVNTDLSVAS